MERVEDRAGARAPEPAVVALSLVGGLEEVGGVAAAVSVKEPGRRGTLADELEVDVGAVFLHIREGAAVAVDVVESGVELDPDMRSGREEACEDAFRRLGIALVLVRLGSIELNEAHVPPVSENDRVAVENAGNASGGRGARVRSAAGERESKECGEGEGAKPHVPESGTAPTLSQVALSD